MSSKLSDFDLVPNEVVNGFTKIVSDTVDSLYKLWNRMDDKQRIAFLSGLNALGSKAATVALNFAMVGGEPIEIVQRVRQMLQPSQNLMRLWDALKFDTLLTKE